MKQLILFLAGWMFLNVFSAGAQSFIAQNNGPGTFPIVNNGRAASIYVDPTDDWLVHKAAALLQQDIEQVTGIKPLIVSALSPDINNMILIGTITGSPTLGRLAEAKQLDTKSIQNKWEAFSLQTIHISTAGNYQALVITGADKRGAAYGTLELSRQIGVSPWYWWADVPAEKKTALYFKNGIYRYDGPKVKYRGIFINDEAPAFSGWTKEKFGGVNHRMYEHMFELLLRLKANYLWPAMWGNAFNDDDSLNPVMADKWGIVMGTSHHEPMLRAQQEWKRYGKGPWNYDSNKTVLTDFWRKGIMHMGNHESIVTIGMRGDGDLPMTEGTAIQLLEKIVADQRKIIEETTHKPAASTPQLWALYKEVQDYYDKGMRVPDDITLLLCDDNWGNIRRLPKLADKPRKGGYGIYYHFDYVGDPRNYKWINTNNIARIWEQMHLANEYGVKNIWIVNVGDLKPMELPISFFLDYAWNPDEWNADNLHAYYTRWAAAQFGPALAADIAGILQKYAQYASRRKPELLDAGTFSIVYYNEAERVTKDWNALLSTAEKIYNRLRDAYKDAYFQLVLHPVKAFTNLQNLYTAVAKNNLLAKNNNPLANNYANQAKQFYIHDSLISAQYNQLNGGKWNHMMDQTHIGYTYWQQPLQQKLPELAYVTASTVVKDEPAAGTNHRQALPPPDLVKKDTALFYELNGYISIEAAHYTRKKETSKAGWKIIPGIGRDGDGITVLPVTALPQVPDNGAPSLEYTIYTYDTGLFKLNSYFSPTLNFQHTSEGLQYAISVDDEKPVIVSINKDDHNPAQWSQWVANNVIVKTTNHHIAIPGKHTIRYFMVTPAVVLQKIIADFGGLKPSYLGPQETLFKPLND